MARQPRSTIVAELYMETRTICAGDPALPNTVPIHLPRLAARDHLHHRYLSPIAHASDDIHIYDRIRRHRSCKCHRRRASATWRLQPSPWLSALVPAGETQRSQLGDLVTGCERFSWESRGAIATRKWHGELSPFDAWPVIPRCASIGRPLAFEWCRHRKCENNGHCR